MLKRYSTWHAPTPAVGGAQRHATCELSNRQVSGPAYKRVSLHVVHVQRTPRSTACARSGGERCTGWG